MRSHHFDVYVKTANEISNKQFLLFFLVIASSKLENIVKFYFSKKKYKINETSALLWIFQATR